jgi:hypothetical protein
VVQVPPVRQDNLDDESPISVYVPDDYRNCLAERQIAYELSGSRSIWLAALGRVNPV